MSRETETPRRTSTPDLARDLELDCSPSALVTLELEALSAVAEHIRDHPDFLRYRRYTWDDPKFWYPEGSPSERSQYFTVGNAINFRFWSLEDREVKPSAGTIDGERLIGSMYMWRCLRRCITERRYPVLEARFLAQLTAEQFGGIFADDSGFNPLAVAQEDRIANLRDLGAKLEQSWGGQFMHALEAAGGSLVEFARLSARFRAFDDPLFKLTMVNTILHLGSGIVVFDAEPLPGIDYHLVKQLLRQGIVIPKGRLAEKLERRRVLDAREAFELRRMVLCAFVEISAQTGISGEILDNKWWWNRLKCKTIEPVCSNSETAGECPFLGPCAQNTQLSMPIEETRYY